MHFYCKIVDFKPKDESKSRERDNYSMPGRMQLWIGDNLNSQMSSNLVHSTLFETLLLSHVACSGKMLEEKVMAPLGFQKPWSAGESDWP